MPVYEYLCRDCGRSSDILVRAPAEPGPRNCPRCGSSNTERVPAGFAYHRSLRTKVEQLDPKYDRMVEASNPDLSFDSLRKKYRLDRPATAKPGD